MVSLDILPPAHVPGKGDEGNIRHYTCDISQRTQVEHVASQIREEVGGASARTWSNLSTST